MMLPLACYIKYYGTQGQDYKHAVEFRLPEVIMYVSAEKIGIQNRIRSVPSVCQLQITSQHLTTREGKTAGDL